MKTDAGNTDSYIGNKLSVAAREGMREGITGDQHEGGHVMSRVLLLSPTGESLIFL